VRGERCVEARKNDAVRAWRQNCVD